MIRFCYLLLTVFFVLQLTGCIKRKPQGSIESEPKTTSFTYGTISGSRGANVRQGPGTSNSVIGSLSTGSSVKILNKQKNWYNVEATLNKQAREGWVYAPLIKTNTPIQTSKSTQIGGPNNISGQNNDLTDANNPDQSDIIYMGYTKDFLPIKQLLANGQRDELSMHLAAASGKEEVGINPFWKQNDDFLRSIEGGMIMLDLNESEQAIKNFSTAEKINEERESGSLVVEWAQTGGGWLAGAISHDAWAPYDAEGYEKVLMLNYLSIAHLLQGERKAYNVARRSIDWQNIEKKAFDVRMSKVTEQQGEQQTGHSTNGETSSSAQSGIAGVFDALNTKAKDVPSAYVNPFGFYVTGMIQEYESYQDRSLRDNARISYKKALALNPSSQTLKQAVKDLKKKRAPSGKRLLHVVVADGFVPEKKVLSYEFQAGDIKFPLKITIYQPIMSQVGRIEIQTSRGKRLARLSPVADVEALCIRHQKDTEVFRNLRVALAFSSTVAEKIILTKTLGIFGKWISDVHDTLREPDTRSWMTLPATIQAARIHLSNKINKVKLVTYSRKGKKMASQVLKLTPNKPGFIYARSIDKTLYAHVSKPLWVTKPF